MSNQSFSVWLQCHLPLDEFVVAFVFGSVAKSLAHPRDCDLFLVTKLGSGTTQWEELRCRLAGVCKLFEHQFKLPLSIELLSVPEYEQWLTWQDPIYRSPKMFILNTHVHS